MHKQYSEIDFCIRFKIIINMNEHIVVIRGPIGAGKTSTMLALRGMLPGSSLVETDLIKRMIEPSSSSDWRRNVALRTGVFLAEQLLSEKRSVVVEIHAHDLQQREVFRELAQRATAQFVSVLLCPPLEVCLRRARERQVPDISYDIDDAMVQRHYEGVIRDSEELVIDTNELTPIFTAQRILKLIDADTIV